MVITVSTLILQLGKSVHFVYVKVYYQNISSKSNTKANKVGNSIVVAHILNLENKKNNKMGQNQGWTLGGMAEGKFLVRTKPLSKLITMSYPIRRDLFLPYF